MKVAGNICIFHYFVVTLPPEKSNIMEIIIGILIGIVVTAAVAALVLIRKNRQVHDAEQAVNDVRNQLVQAQAETNTANELLKAEVESRKTTVEMLKAENKEQLDHMQKLMTEQIENAGRRMLQERQAELEQRNKESMTQLMQPLRQQMDDVRKIMSETKSANEKSTSSLEGALKAMVEQTGKLGTDAQTLANALRNKGKVHGDWGEQVLSDILRDSGLREGEEFMTQVSYKDKRGNELRPDVVINMPDKTKVIVDSKVSLKDYMDAVEAETEEERLAAVKRNYESMVRHVKELADKNYPSVVEGAMNYVLMFVPNEGGYVMAMNYDSSLGQKAFDKGVILVNPTNLMLALNLVLHVWQNTRQEDNCRKIIEAANGMYEKVVGLVDTCNRLGSQLDTARKTYDTAMNQLTDGTGNVLRRVEGLKELGVTSTKKVTTRRNQADALASIETTE